ncbi:hypothetical protein os1_13650 [Comamonadaceae bacterium OS-1]|nr:hypothetical protein os1_13650 [Comamonadaceae bacterium OS-1]
MPNIESSLTDWHANLCKSVDVSGLFARSPIAHKWKSPWRALLLREAVGWRLVDLLIQSNALYKAQHLLGARILVRAAFETLGILIYSNQEMRRVVSGHLDFHEFSGLTSQLLLGSRDNTTSLKAKSILTVLQKADKRFPGLLAWYEVLCESAHPNCEGLLVGYSTGDTENYQTTFENRWAAMYSSTHESSIEACMVIFDAEYNSEWPDAFESLEKWIESNDQSLEATRPKEG